MNEITVCIAILYSTQSMGRICVYVDRLIIHDKAWIQLPKG